MTNYLDSLELSARTRSLLEKEGVMSEQNLLDLNLAPLALRTGVGRKTLDELFAVRKQIRLDRARQTNFGRLHDLLKIVNELLDGDPQLVLSLDARGRAFASIRPRSSILVNELSRHRE